MPKMSRRMKQINETIRQSMQPDKPQDAQQALKLLKEVSSVKFIESMDISVMLGIDARKSDQIVRGSVLLPNGVGREVRVAVLAQGLAADAAKEAGADIVGFADLIQSMSEGNIDDFDVLVATPEAMPLIGKLGPILGPRGLMPNPKMGTVTSNVAVTVNNIKKGQVQYKTDKQGIVHSRIGTVNFSVEELLENLKAFITDLKRVKPVTSKGVYLKKIVLSTTMGPGVIVDPSSVV